MKQSKNKIKFDVRQWMDVVVFCRHIGDKVKKIQLLVEAHNTFIY